MDLKELLILYRRWFWLPIAGLILGLVAGFAFSKIQTPVYEASAKVLITRSREQGVADMLPISDQQLVLTYQQLLKTRPIRDEAKSRLGINIDPDNIRVEVIPNTQILQIKIQDQNHEMAAAIANTLVQILIEQNENLQAGRYAIYEENLSSQIAQVQAQIDGLQSQITQINQTTIEEQLKLVRQQIEDLQTRISSLEQEIAKAPNSLNASDRAALAEKQTQVDQLHSLLYLYQQIETNLTFIGRPAEGGSGPDDPRVSSLQATLGLYQELYLDLLNNLEAVKLARVQSTPTVTLIEDATIPENPVRPIPILYTALSGIVGFIIAAGAVLLIDYFDDTLKTSQKIQEVLDIPVIGQIIEIASKKNSSIINGQASSAVLNAFGSLRINVSRLMQQKQSKTILITSAGLAEGKTTISVNLAAAFVTSGRKVILLDADFYNSQIHSRLELDNQAGLTDILTKNIDWQEAAHAHGGMTVITSGTPSSVSAALLESEKMSQLLEKLQKKADVIILDGPPLFIADSQILASKVGGVLLVVRHGNTLTAAARAMIDQLRLMEANVLGAVLNRIDRASNYYYDGDYHRIISAESQIGSEKTSTFNTSRKSDSG